MNRVPALFVSHGAPDFALEPGAIGRALTALGEELPPLEAVVVVSPHWRSAGPHVSASARPATIHDFRGFDEALYRLRYPAPGAPGLADRIVSMLQDRGWPAAPDPVRGLDHGAWVPLLHLLPNADVPVVQISLPAAIDADGALALGEALAPLGEQGVLVIGSGSLTHNLHEVFGGVRDSAYAREFVDFIRDAITRGDVQRLASALDQAPQARRAHPTPEHYWPLLVAVGAAHDRRGRVVDGGMRHGVLSMDAFIFDEG